MPWVEAYLPNDNTKKSQSQEIRIRMLKTQAAYSIIPYRSDFSYEGMKVFLEELEFIEPFDPYFQTRKSIKEELTSKVI